MPNRVVDPMLWRLCVLLFLLIADSVWADEAELWLERVNNSSRGYVYNATVVFSSGAELAVIRVSQSLQEGKLQQTFVTLTGKPQTLITADGVVQRERGAGPPEYLESPLAVGRMQDLNLQAIRQNYRIILASSDRVAGRPVRQVVFEAKDGYRYGRRAWIDNETGLALRSTVGIGPVLEQMVFADLQLSGTASAAVQAGTAAPQGEAWPGATPPGFELKAAVGGPAHRHWVFSDGLAAVSVFAEPDPAATAAETWQQGATNSVARSVDGMRWTALGDAPVVALEIFLPVESAEAD